MRANTAPEQPRPAERWILTIDLEDWFDGLDLTHAERARAERRIEQSTAELIAIMADHGATATVFVPSRVADEHAHLIRYLEDAGHEIGTRGHAHEVSESEFARELDRSLEAIARAGVPRVSTYRAPGFSITGRSLSVLDILADFGITHDCSVMPTHHPRHRIPATPFVIRTSRGQLIHELPVTTVGIGPWRVPIASGRFLRGLPRLVTRALTTHLQQAGQPVTVHIHPWELDAQQPRVTLPARIGATRYQHIKSTRSRLVSILRDHCWSSVRDAYPPDAPIVDAADLVGGIARGAPTRAPRLVT
jgi:polysaccharide deacetylase family protein (PEP-CTERM system associated)